MICQNMCFYSGINNVYFEIDTNKYNDNFCRQSVTIIKGLDTALFTHLIYEIH